MTGVSEERDEPDDESGRRRIFPALARNEDDDRLTERIVHQWAQMRAERRVEPAFTTGPSNFSRAQVPWGLDLAAAWSWRLIVIAVATLGLLWTLRFFAVITHGFGFMRSYAAELSLDERWAVVAYVKALQRSQAQPVAQMPAQLRQEAERWLR